jgi:hypothetical protein
MNLVEVMYPDARTEEIRLAQWWYVVNMARTFRFHKREEISYPAEALLASHTGMLHICSYNDDSLWVHFCLNPY